MSYLEKRWERIRKGGAVRFVLMWGVLYWGLLTAVLASAITALFGSAGFLESLRWGIVGFPIAGALWGAFMWAHFESRYRREHHDLSNKPLQTDRPSADR